MSQISSPVSSSMSAPLSASQKREDSIGTLKAAMAMSSGGGLLGDRRSTSVSVVLGVRCSGWIVGIAEPWRPCFVQ